MEVADIGVPTNARAALPMAASAVANSSEETVVKRRKISHHELKFSSSPYVQLRSQRRRIMKEESKISPTTVEMEDSSSSPSSGTLPPSCCSRNQSSELEERRRSLVDLEVESAEVETSTCGCGGERREMSPPNELRVETDEHESTKKPPSEHNYMEKSTVKKMPTEWEIEEFFMAAEKDIQKKFEEKYNYDIVKDVPQEGRYEWIPLKQKQ